MRKRLFAVIIVLVILISIPVTAYAVTPRSLLVIPELTFAGKTATCALTVTTESTENQIMAVIKLWDGDICLKTWNDRGDGYLFFSDYYTVSHSGEFTLTADVYVNNVKKPQVSDSAICK